MACPYPSGPFTQQSCLGGRNGSGFMTCGWIEGQRSLVVKALDMWWEDNLRGLQVTYDDNTQSEVFGRSVREHARINFAPGERITSLTLWASADGTRIARIRIKTSAGQTFDEGNDKPNLQERSMEVGSGVLVGMVGRHGWDIDMLGAVFLRSPVGGTVGVENVNSSYPSGPFTPKNCIGGLGGSEFMTCGWNFVVKALDVWWDVILRGLQVTYADNTRSDVFGKAVNQHARINFAPGELITSLTLWANAEGTRIARIRIKTSAGQTLDKGNDKGNLQARNVEVGSGVLVGMVGRHGWDIDMLGAMFLSSPVGEVDVKNPTSPLSKVEIENVTSSYPSGPFTPKNCIGGQGGSGFMTCGWIDGEKALLVKALDVWWDDNLRGLQVTYADDSLSDVFGGAVCEHARINFAPGERITSLTLWASEDSTRVARIRIKTSEGQKFDKGSDKRNLQERSMEVGSGVLVGMVGRHCWDIDMLGAVFLRSPVVKVEIDVVVDENQKVQNRQGKSQGISYKCYQGQNFYSWNSCNQLSYRQFGCTNITLYGNGNNINVAYGGNINNNFGNQWINNWGNYQTRGLDAGLPSVNAGLQYGSRVTVTLEDGSSHSYPERGVCKIP